MNLAWLSPLYARPLWQKNCTVDNLYADGFDYIRCNGIYGEKERTRVLLCDIPNEKRLQYFCFREGMLPFWPFI